MARARRGPDRSVRPGVVALAFGLVAVLVACAGETSPSSPAEDGPVSVTAADAGFRLTLESSGRTFVDGQPIEVRATLVYEGDAPEATVWGSGDGPVFFSLSQVDGPIVIGSAASDDCTNRVFARGVPVPFPFVKSGGFSNDDPNAAFYRAFFADPQLRLPAGTWRIVGQATGYLAPCEMEAPTLDVRTEIQVVVTPP